MVWGQLAGHAREDVHNLLVQLWTVGQFRRKTCCDKRIQAAERVDED